MGDGLSARVFGLDSWSLLLPQAIAGVLVVRVTYLIVRRWFSAIAALVAGAVLALTPAAALMFRYDNPDAMLTLLLAPGAYALLRAIEAGRTAWLLAAGALIGFAFLTKSLQAFLVLPPFALVWLVAAPERSGGGCGIWRGGGDDARGRRLVGRDRRADAGGLAPLHRRQHGRQRAGAGLRLQRPRPPERRGRPGGGGGGMGFSGSAGIGRLFNDQMGGQISWLLPFAAVGLVAGLWARRGTPRTDRMRAAYLLWGGWAVTHALVFSYMTGIVHTYYTVAMAPAVGALVGMGGVELSRMRERPSTRWALSAAIAASGVVGLRPPGADPRLRAGPLLAGADRLAGGRGGAAGRRGAAAPSRRPGRRRRSRGRAARRPGRVRDGHRQIDPRGRQPERRSHGRRRGGRPGRDGDGRRPAGCAPPRRRPQRRRAPGRRSRAAARPRPPRVHCAESARRSGGGGASANATLVDYLRAHRGSARWIAATSGAGSAGPLQLAADAPVMSMGGFNGGDPSPTLAEFVALVRSGDLRFYVGGGVGGGGFGGRDGDSAAIQSWVEEHGTQVDSASVGGATVYDLASAAAS